MVDQGIRKFPFSSAYSSTNTKEERENVHNILQKSCMYLVYYINIFGFPTCLSVHFLMAHIYKIKYTNEAVFINEMK